mmetsp:Transcript_32811/g.49467  ORF Transcript_32811/g.49467 Transcript_32811/m.49467 type:complete len:554 (+) Transcript_32811:1821-3482(+)
MKQAVKYPSSTPTSIAESKSNINATLHRLDSLDSKQSKDKIVSVEHALGWKLPSMQRSMSEPNLSKEAINGTRCPNCGYVSNQAAVCTGSFENNTRHQNALHNRKHLSQLPKSLTKKFQRTALIAACDRDFQQDSGNYQRSLHDRKFVSNISPVPYLQLKQSYSRTSTESESSCSSMTTLCHPAVKPFEAEYQEASTSLLLLGKGASTTVPNPPALEAYVSSKQFLMSQPMIQSPAPTAFSGSQGSNSNSVIRCQGSYSTPLYDKSFRSAIFSVTSSLSTFDSGYGVTLSGSSKETEESSFAGISVHSKTVESAKSALSSTSRQSRIQVKKFGSFTKKQSKAKADNLIMASPESRVDLSSARERFRQLPQDQARLDKITNARRVRGKLLRRKMVSPINVSTTKPVDFAYSGNAEKEEAYCSCQRSKCLKLYCVCFQRGHFCKGSCMCVDCKNTSTNDDTRKFVMESIKKRRPDAFGKRVREFGLGCGCQKNRCLKKYCFCFAEKIPCDDNKCSCKDCHNKKGDKARYGKSNGSYPSKTSAADNLIPVQSTVAI